MSLTFLALDMKTKGWNYTCSKCGWSNTRPSWPSGIIDAVLRMFFLVPIRCRRCRNRFYRFSSTAASVAKRFEREDGAVSAGRSVTGS